MARITVDLTHLPEMTNPKFYPLFENQDRYLVLVGGGGSGKSVFAAQKVVRRTIEEKGHRFLVVRKVAKTLRESAFAEVRAIISDWGLMKLFNINKSDLHITCKNGNEILFAGLDDVEKLKSIFKVTNVWIEEASELEISDYRQLDIRLRGQSKWYKQMIFSFNPIYKGHWLEGEFVNIDWTAKRDNCTVNHSTYKNNKFLDPAQTEVLESFKESDPYYYSVYCLGEWGVLGKTVFDAQVVTKRISQLRDKKPLKQGFFIYKYENEKIVDESIQWVEDSGGYIKIFEDVQKGYPYVIGGDTAGEGSDNFTGQVLNNVTAIQAAVLKHQFDEDLYSKQMYCLGKYYNNALEGIETNYSTYPVKELERLGYNRQYTREHVDTFTGALKKSYGFRTDKLTRPLVLANLVQLVREHPGLFNDIETLEEMLTFVRNEKGKPEAQSGKTDDLIIGLAIAHHIRTQQIFHIEAQVEDNDEDDEEPKGGTWYD
ncbi:MAG: PBSX family phage terminase large subunit [Candidatus Omnitrophota bacterium]